MKCICLNDKSVLFDAKTSSESVFRPKDSISTLTHFIGLLLAVAAMPFLLIYKSAKGSSLMELIAFGIFSLAMVGLYAASSAYHCFNLKSAEANARLKKMDHMMIFIFIASTYTPLCISYMPKNSGIPLLAAVWIIAAAGLIFKFFWVNCPKWISSVLYISMGWVCIFAFPSIIKSLSTGAFLWLLFGGIAYTAGGVIYSLKLPLLRKLHPDFGEHELFHIFVMTGSFCHFMTMLH